MRFNTIHSRKRNYGRSTNMIVVERERHARLTCGHEVDAVPLVTGPGTRRYFRCPECRMLRRAVSR